MSTRSAARKAEPWSSFLYSDPEGFQVKTVQISNGATGRGLFADRNFDDKEFLLTSWGPRSTTKTSNFDYVMELREGKQGVFIDTSEEKNSGMTRSFLFIRSYSRGEELRYDYGFPRSE